MIQVLKFGGSSVANATNMSRVLDIVSAAATKGKVVLISSAIKGCTDSLLELARLAEKQTPVSDAEQSSIEFAEKVRDLKGHHLEIIKRLFTGKEREDAEKECHELFAEMAAAPADEIVTFGEIFSTRILARKLACDGIFTKWLDSRILVIKDNQELTYGNISAAVALEPKVQVFVAPGFIASTYEGKHTTLGRGGSDLSAALYAAALKADSLQIWTDVPGIMTTNPKDVPAARTVPEMSYRAALDMATNGAKVLYAPTVIPAMEAGIAIHILNTFDPNNPGTTVKDVTLSGWAGVASMEDKVKGEALLCLVGEGAPNIGASFGPKVCSRMEDCLKKAGIKTLSSSCDGTNVTATVRLNVEKQALAAIHREFFESVPQSVINLYVAGYGAVGKAFVEMLAQESASIARRSGKILKLAGIANSRKFVLDPDGIAPAEVAERLENGQPNGYVQGSGKPSPDFISALRAVAPRHSIFLDLTDSENIYTGFVDLLHDGINIITSNRRSIATPYVEYAAIMSAAAENGCFVRHETTVGSALPLLESISRSANAGEEILSIEAVVSCTLNQILSSYARYPGSFAETVRRAQEAGLTEKDPRQDLAGRDALRKLLILAREAGIPLEASDVVITPAVPYELMDLSIDEFYVRLQKMEPKFEADEKKAADAHLRQRFLAVLKKDVTKPLGYSATISIRNVPQDHPAFWIMGTENAIIVRSAFHPYPLVVQGAGEGAKMAAGSVLNEILK